MDIDVALLCSLPLSPVRNYQYFPIKYSPHESLVLVKANLLKIVVAEPRNLHDGLSKTNGIIAMNETKVAHSIHLTSTWFECASKDLGPITYICIINLSEALILEVV